MITVADMSRAVYQWREANPGCTDPMLGYALEHAFWVRPFTGAEQIAAWHDGRYGGRHKRITLAVYRLRRDSLMRAIRGK